MTATKRDAFSVAWYLAVPLSVPVIVYLGTALFQGLGKEWLWIPLLCIYWGTTWTFTMVYQAKRGGVLTRERFEPTMKLRGNHAWLQYLVVYGPLAYAIPLFLVNYAARLSPAMLGAILVAAAVNGPSEEVYWRACVDEAGKRAGFSERHRLAVAPVLFAFWHTAFVIHLFPWNASWFVGWGSILFMTWTSGLAWLWTMHRSGRLVPQALYHACSNVLNTFPMILVTVIGITF